MEKVARFSPGGLRNEIPLCECFRVSVFLVCVLFVKIVFS
jgi:hypothetical protein